MLDQVKGYGGSLSKFMATQNAVPLLSRTGPRSTCSSRRRCSGRTSNYIIVADDKA